MIFRNIMIIGKPFESVRCRNKILSFFLSLLPAVLSLTPCKMWAQEQQPSYIIISNAHPEETPSDSYQILHSFKTPRHARISFDTDAILLSAMNGNDILYQESTNYQPMMSIHFGDKLESSVITQVEEIKSSDLKLKISDDVLMIDGANELTHNAFMLSIYSIDGLLQSSGNPNTYFEYPLDCLSEGVYVAICSNQTETCRLIFTISR
ncbi:MAG: hypothetical protein K2M88_02690 [Muribaculaceae bacterium]|nr:hypothetical protein [Muribaculaceae bacterium]